jgi:hypothetical protein
VVDLRFSDLALPNYLGNVLIAIALLQACVGIRLLADMKATLLLAIASNRFLVRGLINHQKLFENHLSGLV